MARILDLGGMSKEIRKALGRSFQSGHVNFLIGSGASFPAIPAAGQVEQEIADLFSAGDEEEARNRMYSFLAGIQEPTNRLIADERDEAHRQVLAYYRDWLGIIETILAERRTTLLPRQATIFTTNYDLFIEKASVSYPSLKLNDGFSRVPSLDNRMEYSSRNFFITTYNTGNLYDYKVEIPSINLVKLHGSLSWKKDSQEVVFRVRRKELLPAVRTPEQIREFIESYGVVLPQTTKFRTTLMDRTYYELLRIYANELDRENALLISFGFSFGDEHIRNITRRGLKNPTLRLVGFAFDEVARDAYAAAFDGYNNVEIIAPPAGEQIDFARFNQTLRAVLPAIGSEE